MSTALPRPSGTAAKSAKYPSDPAELVALLGKLKARKDAAVKAYDDAAAVVRRLGKGVYTAAGVVVKIEDNNTVNKGKIIEGYGDAVMSPAFDVKKARALLGDEVYEGYYVQGDFKITTTVTSALPSEI